MNSFAAQLNYYTTLISGKDNWTMTDIYADAGISGTSAQKRPDFQRLLSDCRRGRVDKILVKSVSRFARNMADCLSIVRELGVTVIFEKENISTKDPNFDALTSLMAEFARSECEHLTKNSAHTHYMGTISRPTKRTWKKTIRLPGRPEKTITFRME